MYSFNKNTGIYDAASDFSDAASLDLILLIEPFNSSLLIISGKKVLAFESYESDAESLAWFSNGLELNKIESAQKKYRHTHILVANQDFTFIPEEEFNEDILKQYMDFNTALEGLHHYAYDGIDELRTKLIYTMPFNLYANLNNIFPGASVSHAKSPILKYFQSMPKDREQLYVYVRSGSFDVFAFRNNALALANSFCYNTAQDFIYFLMFAIKQLPFDNNNLQLSIGGNIEKDSAIYNLVYKYIRHISFMKPPEDIVFADAFEDMSPHYFINFLV